MADNRQTEIKERILKYAMRIWGITDPRNMDPIVDLLLEVFAYESANLYQEVKMSNSRILHQLSRILIDNKWALPFPAHALMSVDPYGNENCILDAEDHFYTERFIFGKEFIQVFFTPLFSYPLVNAKLHLLAFGDTIKVVSEKQQVSHQFLNKKQQIESYAEWMGFSIEKKYLPDLQNLTICMIPSDISMLPFLRLAQFYDSNGNKLEAIQGLDVEDPFKNAHYFDDIKCFYNDYYFNVEISHANKALKNVQKMFPYANLQESDMDTDVEYFWIKVVLPQIFNSTQLLESLHIYINTYPVVNRKLSCKQHSFTNNGRIIPLPCPKGSYFLNIRTISDDLGREYTNRLQKYEESPSGVFDLYFGDLERFDSDEAADMITRVLQRIKEDGNAFAALNPDMLTAQLKDLFAKINEVEKGIEGINNEEKRQKLFALTVPEPDATSAEAKYWITSGNIANGLDERAFIQQFNMEKYDAASIIFRTPVQGGTAYTDDSKLVNSLRYGLVSRDRIVSKQDIKNYILHKIGNNVESIEIKEGITISSEKKKGFVRIMQIEIKLKQNIVNFTDLSAFAHFLEKDMTEKSVYNMPYKIIFL